MRLYLASHNLGPYANELLKPVGGGRRALFIENARDYYPDEKRANDLQEKLESMSVVEIYHYLESVKILNKPNELIFHKNILIKSHFFLHGN